MSRTQEEKAAILQHAIDTMQRLQREVESARAQALRHKAQVLAVEELLSEIGCDCPCDCEAYGSGHGEDCERCTACRVEEAMKGAIQ